MNTLLKYFKKTHCTCCIRVPAIFLFVTALILILWFFWPGDASFIHDEQKLIEIAKTANESGAGINRVGLVGTRGMYYGPFPVWFYRVCLFVTDDLIVLTLLKLLFVCSLLVSSLFIFIFACDFITPAILPLIFLSPYLWFYSRNLWDNSFNIPITLFGLSCYLWFLKENKWWQLFLTFFCVTISIMTHLMALPFAFAVIVHFVFFNLFWIKKNLKVLLAVLIILFVFSIPYTGYLVRAKSLPGVSFYFSNIFYPFTGAKFFSFTDLSYFLGEGWESWYSRFELLGGFIRTFSLTTCFAYFLFFYGIFLALKNLFLKDKIKFSISILLIFILFFHIILSVLMGLNTHPHYHNGTLVAVFGFISLSVSDLWKKHYFKKVYFTYILALGVCLVYTISLIHFNYGTRSLHYGPTLANQIAVASELNRYDSSTIIQKKAFHSKEFPKTIKLLQTIYQNNKEPKIILGKNEKLIIDYSNQTSGKIEVILKNETVIK